MPPVGVGRGRGAEIARAALAAGYAVVATADNRDIRGDDPGQIREFRSTRRCLGVKC